LADYKVPRTVVVLPALPRNATGKILKTTLRQMPLGQ
jgi:acyl-coenzyme A synthetase/AMP-(fatty) acid ligase